MSLLPSVDTHTFTHFGRRGGNTGFIVLSPSVDTHTFTHFGIGLIFLEPLNEYTYIYIYTLRGSNMAKNKYQQRPPSVDTHAFIYFGKSLYRLQQTNNQPSVDTHAFIYFGGGCVTANIPDVYTAFCEHLGSL